VGLVKNPDCALDLAAGGQPLKPVCEVLGVARSAVAARQVRDAGWQDGRRPRRSDDTGLLDEIRVHVAGLPSYGYRRIWALLRRSREMVGVPCVNHRGSIA
jgi:putative transposase